MLIGHLARHRILAAIGSGGLLAFALPMVFPIFGRTEILPGGALTALAYVALVPFLLAVEDAGPRARFGLGVLCSLSYYSVAIWWIYVAMHTFGGIATPLAVPILYLLLGYMSVYWGLAAGDRPRRPAALSSPAAVADPGHGVRGRRAGAQLPLQRLSLGQRRVPTGARPDRGAVGVALRCLRARLRGHAHERRSRPGSSAAGTGGVWRWARWRSC